MFVLHVTNGDSAVETLSRAGIAPAISWRDALHEGPVPTHLSSESLCDIRADFLASCGWGDAVAIASDMRQRDRAILEAEVVTLWFEHDLYDQLQLIQILATRDGRQAWLAQSDTFLGPMQTEEVNALVNRVQPVSAAQYALARRAWAAFGASDPVAVPDLLRSDLSCLPHLRAAFARLLEERPGSVDGLSRTERQILQVAATGPVSFADLFHRTQALEDAAFTGDDQLMLSVKRLAQCRVPLLTTDPWRLTAAGRNVLEGSANHLELNRIDRWSGGIRFVS